MKKQKNRFSVFRYDILDYGDGRIEECKTKVAETWAVSEKQAVSNYQYRTGCRSEVVPWTCDGCRSTFYIAEVAS